MAELYDGMMDIYRLALYLLAIMALIKYLHEEG